ncbi:flagellar biosynthetic protein FliR [Sulfitobacter sp. LCG007]
MNTLAELLRLTEATFWQAIIAFLRVGAFSSLLPAFGEHSVPMRIKLAVAIVFTMIVAPAIPAMAPPDGAGAFVRLALAETVIGVALGIGLRFFVFALQTAGSIAAQSTSLSQVLGGAAVEPIPAMGYILVIGGLALAVMTGMHVRAAELLILSYDVLPAGMFPDASVLSDWGVDQVRRMFSLAFTLAAPFVILSVLYNLALGAINKAMPQLMVAFVGAPVITCGGLFLLCVAAPVMIRTWLETMQGFLAAPFGAVP